jgi:PDZ domain-containing protein
MIQPVRRRQPTHVWVLSVVIVVMLIVGGWRAIDEGANGYYAFAPGTAPQLTDSVQCRANSSGELLLPNGKPCAMISVPGGRGHALAGSLFMVDVLVGPATPGDYILSKLGLLHTFQKGVQLLPASAVLGTTPPSQLACEDAQQMTGSTSAAAVVALRRLGYQVKENDLGALLTEIEPHTPAAVAGLKCNDLVTAVNSVTVHTADEFVTAIRTFKPGQTIRLTVQRAGSGGKTHSETVSATLGTFPVAPGQTAAPNRPFLGVVSMTRMTFTMPFNVTINVGGIGGPSAGLALTLGLIDLLSDGDLTGGHRIAATGTINLDGSVGDVGGVAQKTVAVRRAGAQVFFVPPQELKTARSEAGSMKVFAVSNLQQALTQLQALGGRPPTQIERAG